MQALKKKYFLLLLVCAAFFSTQCDSDSELLGPIAFKPIQDEQLFSETNHLYVISGGSTRSEESSEFYRIDLMTGIRTKLFETGGITDKLVMSEDERYLVTVTRYSIGYDCYYCASKMELHDLVARTTRVLFSDLDNPIPYPHLIDGETSTLFYSEGQSYHRLNLETGEDIILANDGYIYLLDFHPITKDILVSAGSGVYPYSTIEFYTIDWNGDPTSQKSIKGVVEAKSFMPDGSGILAVHEVYDGDRFYRKIVIYDLATNSFQDVTTTAKGNFSYPSTTSDGKYILCHSDDPIGTFIFEVGTQAYTQQTFSGGAIGFFDNDQQFVYAVSNVSDCYWDCDIVSTSLYSRFATFPH